MQAVGIVDVVDEAAYVAALPPESVQLTKHLIKRGDAAAIHDTLHYEAEHFKQRRLSAEAQSAFVAFFKKAN